MKASSRTWLFSAVLLVSLAAAASVAQGAACYTMTRCAGGLGLNDAGQVVGGGPSVWQNGVTTDLGLPAGFDDGSAEGISESGRYISGYLYNGGLLGAPGTRGFLVIDGQMTILEPRAGDVACLALQVNNDGVAVGSSSPTGIYDEINGIYDNYAVYWKDGVIHELPSLGGQNSTALHINNAGVIVGESQRADGTWAVCRWVDGVPEDLGASAGSWSRAINPNGQIAVNAQFQGDQFRTAALWDNGTFTEVAGLPGMPNTATYGINSLEQIVGMSFVSYDVVNGYVGRSALLWDDGITYDLNDLIPADSGWFLRWGRDINDRGQIVVSSINTLTGQPRNFLLTPVPILTPELSGDATADITYDRYGNVGGSSAGLGDGDEMVGGTATLDNFQLTGSYATMMFFYEDEDLAYRGVLEESLRLYWYNESLAQWVLAGNDSNLTWNPLAQFVLGGPTGVLGDWGLNMVDNYVWANIDHASTYGLAGQAQVPAPGALVLGMLGVAGLALFRRMR